MAWNSTCKGNLKVTLGEDCILNLCWQDYVSIMAIKEKQTEQAIFFL